MNLVPVRRRWLSEKSSIEGKMLASTVQWENTTEKKRRKSKGTSHQNQDTNLYKKGKNYVFKLVLSSYQSLPISGVYLYEKLCTNEKRFCLF